MTGKTAPRQTRAGQSSGDRVELAYLDVARIKLSKTDLMGLFGPIPTALPRRLDAAASGQDEAR